MASIPPPSTLAHRRPGEQQHPPFSAQGATTPFLHGHGAPFFSSQPWPGNAQALASLFHAPKVDGRPPPMAVVPILHAARVQEAASFFSAQGALASPALVSSLPCSMARARVSSWRSLPVHGRQPLLPFFPMEAEAPLCFLIFLGCPAQQWRPNFFQSSPMANAHCSSFPVSPWQQQETTPWVTPLPASPPVFPRSIPSMDEVAQLRGSPHRTRRRAPIGCTQPPTAPSKLVVRNPPAVLAIFGVCNVRWSVAKKCVCFHI
jgi:hypothetical protein